MKENRSFVQSLLLLFLSFTFANSVCVALHEMGHAIFVLLSDAGNVKLVIHPYLSSYVVWDWTPRLLGYMDAAGPVFNMLVSILVFVLFFRFRKPTVLPFLLMAPVAVFQEGLNSAMQILLQLPGTDSMNIIASGVPQVVLLSFAIALFLIGIIWFTLMLGLFGIERTQPYWRIVLVIFSATGLNMVIIILFSLFQRPQEMQRGIVLLTAMFVFSFVFAAFKKIGFIDALSIQGGKDYVVTNRTILKLLIIALVPVVIGLVFYPAV